MNKVVFIGAGNVATHLAIELQKKQFDVVQIYSRTYNSASKLASLLKTKATDKIEEITPDADLYIFSVKDAILSELILRLPTNNALWLHTAGSIPIDVFEKKVSRYGVIYPFQTFSKTRFVNFKSVPLFIEGSDKIEENNIIRIANKISQKVYPLSSEKRKYVHLSGVFACNFTNYMYALAENILSKENIPFEFLLPLIDETASKIHAMNPKEAQTGPAVRYDINVIEKHLKLIEDPNIRELYELISKNIYKTNNE